MSNSQQTVDIVYIIGALILVGSALIARHMPIGTMLRMAAGWVALFFAAFILFAARDDILALAHQVINARQAESTGVQVGQELRIRQALDGHFWVDGALNGKKVRFLIDSGATVTSVSRDTASRASIDSAGSIPAIVQTANGTIRVERGRAELLQVGQIERRDFSVHVSDAFGDMNVLGMNFLSSLSGWRVEGRTLILVS